MTPAAGESVSEGTILEWHAKVGDPIKVDDTIVEISTDKVDIELPSPATGTVSEMLVAEGDTVTVGQVIARIAAGSRAASAPAAAARAPAEAPRRRSVDGAQRGQPRLRTARRSRPSRRARRRPRASISARRGQRTGGRITKSDVLAAAAGNGAARRPERRRATAERGSAQLLRGGAAALARYMEQSRSIPTATSFRTLTVTALDARRRELKARAPQGLLHAPDRLRDRARGGARCPS